MKIINGQLKADGKKFALVASRFNELITNKLVSGAEDMLKRHGASDEDISLVWVPGAFEIPAAAKKVADSGKYDAVICLGCVIRGATPHFDYVAAEVSKGVAAISIQGKIPVVFGVLTTDSIEQAIERAGTKSGNKGSDAAVSAIELVSLYSQI
ncbi:MAG: 6,7-dimethyl-8-ribityllumazine synthase [Endomicrobium sp.]|jgi:6,7-dimethyl-8-ribityllumazine synthase|nr:6,7-dimethyl-8-ribityllumazine synthase [Endomicrobium sp.]